MCYTQVRTPLDLMLDLLEKGLSHHPLELMLESGIELGMGSGVRPGLVQGLLGWEMVLTLLLGLMLGMTAWLALTERRKRTCPQLECIASTCNKTANEDVAAFQCHLEVQSAKDEIDSRLPVRPPPCNITPYHT